MKILTRKSLLKKLRALHAATGTTIEDVNSRFLLEGFIDDLSAGFWNIHVAARILKEKGFAI